MLTKRENGIYYFHYGTGKSRIRKSLKTKNKRIAEKLYTTIHTEVLLKEKGIPISSLSVQELFEEYYKLEILPKKKKELMMYQLDFLKTNL